MARYIVGRGTLLNTATVAAGAGVGLLIGQKVPESYEGLVMGGIGLVTVATGVKMFLSSKNMIVVVASIVLGAVIGLLLGVQVGIENFADWAKGALGAEGSKTFSEAIITTSVLFCVGPLTLLGCLQDALEDKIELIGLKSAMDGFGSIIFAATLGAGVLVTAGVVFVVQGAFTIAARPLKKLLHDEAAVNEATAVGGIILMAIGLGLMKIPSAYFPDGKIPSANFLPSLFIAPVLATFAGKIAKVPRSHSS